MVANMKTKIIPSINGIPILQLSEKQVTTALSCSRSHLWQKISAGDYPPPIKRDTGNRWDATVLLAWYEADCPHFKTWYEAWEGRRQHGIPLQR